MLIECSIFTISIIIDSDFTVDLECNVIATLDTESDDTQSITYKASLTPTVDSVTPRRGGTAGGTDLTIVGQDFG